MTETDALVVRHLEENIVLIDPARVALCLNDPINGLNHLTVVFEEDASVALWGHHTCTVVDLTLVSAWTLLTIGCCYMAFT